MKLSAAYLIYNSLNHKAFSQYRTIEIDAQRATLFAQLEGVPYLSRRFILDRYLGLNEEEMVENDRLWKEENQPGNMPDSTATGDLGSLGIRGSDVESFQPTDVDAENAGDDVDGGADAPELNDDMGATNDEV